MSYTVFMTTQNHARLVLPARSVLIAFLVFIFISCGASVAIRRTYVELAPFWTAASRFILAAFLFWVIVFFKRIPLPTQIGTWIAFLYLVILVTIVSFVLYLFMLNKWSASGTSYGFVLMPFVTIIEASIFAGEEITSNFLVGAGMVLIGVFVGALLPSMTKSAIVEECKDSSGQVLPRCG